MSVFTIIPTLQEKIRFWIWNYVELGNFYIMHFDAYGEEPGEEQPAGQGFFFSGGLTYMGPDQKEFEPQSFDREMWRQLDRTPGVAIRKCTNETEDDLNTIYGMISGGDHGEEWVDEIYCSRNVQKRGEYALAQVKKKDQVGCRAES